MKTKKYTFCIIPSDHGQQKMFEMNAGVLRFLAGLGILLILAVIVSYVLLIPKASKYEALSREVNQISDDRAMYVRMLEDFRKMQAMHDYVRKLLGTEFSAGMDSAASADTLGGNPAGRLHDVVVLENVPSVAPVSGVVTQTFNRASGPFEEIHRGIDIAVKEGTPVRAAASGMVVFSGWTSGLGNTVILQHGSGYVSVYGHNERNLVSDRERVEQGQRIALSGNSGYSTGPHLHFEIWKDVKAVDPALYISEYSMENDVL